MNILAIDTSSVYVSCALMVEGEIVSERIQKNGLVHSKSLMPLVESCLDGHDISEIDLFACVAGPGSFTGVRIGVCAIKGLAQATGKMCVAVNTLDCLKENVPFAQFVCPIMDARRGQVYCAVYENGNIIKPCDACSVDELADFLKNKKTVFVGDGISTYKEKLISILGENALFAPSNHEYTRASAACVCALKQAPVTPEALDAIYLRKPQAEREYDAKHNN